MRVFLCPFRPFELVIMSEIQRLPSVVNPNPVHPNAKTTTQINNGTTTTKTNILLPVCRNCKTQTTPLWRRDETGQVLCNACGLFLKLHGRPRPISLKTDTIKLRNRIKQPNFSKLLGPNTPELKLKDLKVLLLGKKLPKSAKKKPASSSPSVELVNSYSGVMNGDLASMVHSPLQHPTRAPINGGAYPQHIGHFVGGLPHQVQLLHYPSSTPTQFAPGLQRITSPLLLSTSSSVLNARSAIPSVPAATITSPKGQLSAVQAAGALENMSNELGPSATFKGAAPASLNGVSLMGNSGKARTETPVLSTPSSALKSGVSHPPKLPALGSNPDSGEQTKIMASPSFGPQFHFTDAPVKQETPEHLKPSLPPLQHSLASGSQLPHFQTNFGHVAQPNTELKLPQPFEQAGKTHSTHQSSSAGSSSIDQSGANSNVTNSAPQTGASTPSQNSNPERGSLNDNSGNDRNPDKNGNSGEKNGNYEVTLLKTRISELELVNDLYRTRIMELEALEQAARLREGSMRRRLDEMLALQGQDSMMFNNSLKVLKREGDGQEGPSKRSKGI